MAILRSADQEKLQKLLLGQLPTADIERLATEYADDSRLAELADSLTGQNDALLELLHNHETAMIDPEGERLVGRLLERLKPAFPVKPHDDTAAMNKADASTEPSSPAAKGLSQKLPGQFEYYRPIKVLGQGGMGTVYLAEDTRLGREVAIKTLRAELAIIPQAKERFLREARTAAKLEHDNVIPIYSVGEADGTPFLAMPFLKGEPLDALIRRTAGPLPVAATVRMAREIASGLAAAHARGLIHRDIKPANIWLEAPTGRVKILDFGLAKAADAGSEADSETNLTASGAIVGTPAYMAPEQASGHAVDGRADLFSLGCVMYELLAGKRPFSGPNTMSILMSLANHTPPAPDKLSPQCPAALSRLVMQLLAKDPANRPASAEAVIQALAELNQTWPTLPASESDAGSISHDISNPAAQRTTPPGSPTLIAQSQSDRDVPNDGTILLSMVTPSRKPSIPKRRIALALAGVLLTLLAAVVYRIETDKGTVVIEINDDDVEAKLKSNGIKIRDSKSGRVFTIRKLGDLREASGDYKLADGKGLKFVVLDADGLEVQTNEFKLVSGDKVRLLVTAEQNSVASTTSPQALAIDRRAAEYVLLVGGSISIDKNDQERPINAVDDLPGGTFELTSVGLGKNPMVSNAGLAVFKDSKNLMNLDLGFTKVSDEGLAYFKNCKNLTNLSLPYTQMSDAALVHFKDCENLSKLYLGGVQVSDAGLANFKNCKNFLLVDLSHTRVSDASLEQLASHSKLGEVNVVSTKVTEAGVKKLSAALPGCRIHWDGGVIEPTVSPDRRAAEWVLSIGGTVTIDDGQQRSVSAMAELSAGSWKLHGVNLYGKPLTPADLKKLNGLTTLWSLDLGDTKLEDACIKQLVGLTSLRWLAVPGSLMTDAGLRELTGLTNIEQVAFGSTKVTDAGLVHLKAWKHLTSVGLNDTQIGDAGIAHIKDCSNLALINLANTKTTDVGLETLALCPKLEHVYIKKTRVTEAGVKKLSAALPGCRIEWDGGVIEPTVSPDRRAAEYVLSIGGFIKIKQNGEERGVNAGRDLPDGPFELTLVSFEHAPTVSDSGLVHFKNCQNLTSLWLSNAKVSDTGLAFFKDCKKLVELNLYGTPVSDTGLAHFQGCLNLKSLTLSNEQLTDAGLVHFKDCKSLTTLIIGSTQLGDAGLAFFRDCPNLTELHIRGALVTDAGLSVFKDCDKLTSLAIIHTKQVTDAGLAAFKDCRNLTKFEMYGSQVTGVGLAYFNNCQNLTTFNFVGTPINDAGLAHFKNWQMLTAVVLHGSDVTDTGLDHVVTSPKLGSLSLLKSTKVTEAGVKKLSAALPGCKIEWDGGVIEPTVSPDRRAAEYVLSIDGGITIKENGEERQLWEASAKLPQTTFELTTVFLERNPKVNDAGLASFEGCKNLTSVSLLESAVSDVGLVHFKDSKKLTTLNLNGTQVSDAGLAFFTDCKNLTFLTLSHTRVTDAGLAHFKDCTKLTVLALNQTHASDAGVAHFQNCPNLATLILGDTRVTDAGLVHFTNCKQLKHLSLDRLPVTDTGLSIFADCKDLTHLDLSRTKVSDAGLAHFRDCKNLTQLQLIETGISDAGLAHFNDCNKLDVLYLTGTHVTDAGVAHFHDCENLQAVQLSGTQVTDAGLEPFANCPKLHTVHVKQTKVTEAAIKKLSAALPGCKIEWDGGVIDPTVSPDRRAAEYVLSIGGQIEINVNGRKLSTSEVGVLPQEAFELTGVGLAENVKITDAGLAFFENCKNLMSLDLHTTEVSDAGLAHFKNSKNLKVLNLGWCPRVSDAGLAYFSDCKNLDTLYLQGQAEKVSDAGLAYFSECEQITTLFLQGIHVSDAGLAHFRNCKQLTSLYVQSANVTDEGLANFQDCRNLTSLGLHGTPVGDAGLANFRNCKNLVTLSLDSPQISDAGIGYFKDFSKLTYVSLRCVKLSDVWLANFQDCKNLTSFDLSNTQVTDGGLEQLANSPNLTHLHVRQTKVTEGGVKKLSAALPGCKIEWDGGVIEPKASTDR